MYADKMTNSMEIAIGETNRRRSLQMDYNKANDITPKTILKSKETILGQTKVADSKKGIKNYYIEPTINSLAADPVVAYMSVDEIDKLIKESQRKMESAAKDLDFVQAAKLRDEMIELKKLRLKKS
jgi:excinuclease ABC subunit B